MDATIKKIVKMLSDERVERQCAAAVVLGDLRARDAEVIDALGRCLDHDSPLLVLYALEALAGVRSARIARFVMPLLDHEDETIQAHAAALLASQGSRAAATLARELHGAPVGRRRAIVSILARNHDLKNHDRLIRLLPDEEIGEFVQITLRGEIEHMPPGEAGALRTHVTELLRDREWRTDAMATARSLRLLGYMRDARLVRTLLPFVGEEKPVPVRLAALAALRRPLAAARATNDAVKTLLGLADDADATLARAALDTLQGLAVPEDAADRLIELSTSRHAETRKFALEAMSAAGTGDVIRSMLGHLGGDDPAAREVAARALATMKGAPAAIVKELGTSEDPDRVRTLCRLLRGRAEELTPRLRKTITALTIDALEGGLDTADALLDLLSSAEAGEYGKALIARAMKHRKSGRHDRAFALLDRLDAAGLLSEDSRYAAVVSGLRSLASKKDLGRASRTTHPILRHVIALVAQGYPLDTSLPRERGLTPEDLFYLGFNLTESKDEDEKNIGGALLTHLARKSPRSKLGRSAKNKLRLMGLD